MNSPSQQKGTSTTGQYIWHSNLFKRELQALTKLPGVRQEPEWPINPSQGGAVCLGIIFFAQPSEPIARHFCHALGHCTLWALTHGTTGMATLPNPLCKGRVHKFGMPFLSSISSPVFYTEKSFACLLQKYYKSTCTSCKRNTIMLITESFQKPKSPSSVPFF